MPYSTLAALLVRALHCAYCLLWSRPRISGAVPHQPEAVESSACEPNSFQDADLYSLRHVTGKVCMMFIDHGV
jgi:hypothetical protein